MLRLSPIDRELLVGAGQSLHLRDDSVRVLLKWKTARRLARAKAA